MSRIIFNDVCRREYDEYSKWLAMARETLGNYVRRTMKDKDLSFLDVQRRSRDRITSSYVNKIVNDAAGNPSVEKLQALAAGLGVPEDDVFAVARGKPLEPMSLGDFYDGLAKLGINQFHAYGGTIDANDRREIIERLEYEIAQTLKRKKKK